MDLFLHSAVFLILAYSASGQIKPESTDCLSNKDCPSNKLCAEFKCVNPCHLNLNLCGSPNDCKVTNHIPVCACKGGFSGPLNGGSSNGNGKKKFQLNLERKNWHGALVHCISKGMVLATLESKEEHEKLVNQIKSSDVGSYKFESSAHRKRWWLGGSDLHSRGEFIWTSTAQPIEYNNFPGGQPDNAVSFAGEREHCLEISGEDWSYSWNDYLCEHHQFFVCQYYD